MKPTDNFLLAKYDVPTPRYTSYPTVPFWQEDSLNVALWRESVAKNFELYGNEGISLYLHLPFCEQLCTYCGCNKRITVNHGVEMPYIHQLLAEWDMYLAILGKPPLVKEIHLGGGTPTFFSAQNLDYLLGQLISRATLSPDAELSVEVHPNVTNVEQLTILHKHGFRRLSVGIQDFDERVQDIINRFQTFEQTKFIFDSARSIGFEAINADIVFGLPLQTAKSIQETIAKINILQPERIAFYSYAHVPWKSPAQRRYTEKDLPQGEAKRQLYELGRELLWQAGYHEIGLDHFALPQDALFKAAQKGTMRRNFMGYTTQNTPILIGLGASSISETPEAFMQNEKNIETYQNLVQQGELPYSKGHLLNKEDQILRKHILQLMCQGETSWHKPQLYTPFLDTLAQTAMPLQADGLLILDEARKKLSITTKGEPFLRNIAMLFDARHWANQQATHNKPMFSKTI